MEEEKQEYWSIEELVSLTDKVQEKEIEFREKLVKFQWCELAESEEPKVLMIDDSLDVFPVHGVGGILGTLLTGVFASASFGGMGLENSISDQVMIQIVGIIFTIIWCGIFTYIALRVTNSIVGLRITDEDEQTGVDLSEHGEKGYN